MKVIRPKFFKWFALLLVGLTAPLLTTAQNIDDSGSIDPVIDGSNDDVIIFSSVSMEGSGDIDAQFCFKGSTTTASGFDQFATILRFIDGANIDARNSTSYTSVEALAFDFNETYHIWTAIHFASKTCDIYIKPVSTGTQYTIAEGYGWRSSGDLNISSVDQWVASNNNVASHIVVATIDEVDAVGNYPAMYSDATLTGITPDVGFLDVTFDPAVTAYTGTLPAGTTSVNVTAVAAGHGAAVTGDGATDVSSGSGTSTITVTAEDDTTQQVYTVNWTVESVSTDATLKALTTSVGAIDPALTDGVDDYTVVYPSGTSSVEITATKNYAAATVTGDVGTFAVSEGAVATITVTAEDGTTTQNYTITFTEADGSNYALSLPGTDGNSSQVALSGLGLTTLPYTIEMWIKPEGTQTDNSGLFFHREGANQAGIQYSSGWQGSGKLRFMTNTPDDFGVLTDNVSTDEWHHVAVVLTDTSRVIYLDGMADTLAGTFTDYDFSAGTTFYLGWDPGATERAFKGLVDEVRVWNVAKNYEEIDEGAFTLNGDESGLLAYWNFDLNNAAQAVDLTGNGYHGLINGGTYVAGMDVTDATLSSISTDPSGVGVTMEPAFDPATISYTLTVPSGTASVTLSGEAATKIANVVDPPAIDVSGGTGQGVISVTSADGNTTTDYTITINVLSVSNDATLSDLAVDAGYFKGIFDYATTTYEVIAPSGISSVNVTATANHEAASVTGDGAVDVSSGSGTTNITVTAEDGSTIKMYTVNITVGDHLMFGWDGDGHTGEGSDPNDFGWAGTSAEIPWNGANQSGGARYRDYNVAGGHTGFTHEADGSTSDTRQLMFRWDGDAYDDAYYTYPVTLDAHTSYEFTFDYVLGGSATPPGDIQVAVGTTNDGTSLLDSATFTTTSDVTVYRHGTFTFMTGDQSGTYYMTFSGTWAWYGITSLKLIAVDLPDSDADGISDEFDNCPSTANADQADMDGDEEGDVCDDDRDGDGVTNDSDNCPETANADQTDVDKDGIGDVCDDEVVTISLSGTLEFGEVEVGQTAGLTFSLTNSGTDDLVVSEIVVPEGFSVDPATTTIAGNHSAEVTVTFSPTAVKAYDGRITVRSNAGDSTIEVSGTGIETALGVGISLSEVSVGPNPVGNRLVIDWSKRQISQPTILIYDLNGKVQWKGMDLPGERVEIDMTRSSKGVFLLYIHDGARQYRLKLIKD